MLKPEGRADSPKKKRATLERIYGAWLAQPTLRLGQLLSNATLLNAGPDVFNIEDEELAKACEAYRDRANSTR